MSMKRQRNPTDSCPRCRSRPRGLWVRQPRGPASDVLNFWQLSRWRVLFLIGLVFACAVQGRNNGPLDLDRESEPQHRHQPAHGTWTHWGSWSACSSTCGDGVSFRIRRCIRLPGEEPCRAEARQYRVCEQKACPAGTAPFRAMQCALYNSRPILGGQAQYQWVPFHGAANLCDLNCLAIGHNFYYSFGRVLDGTPCSPASPELCISGRCLRAGCDGILGSEALADACGVCGGRNESCVFVQEAFRAAIPASGFFGYRNVTQIPVGARQIKAMDNSRNYLALMEANQHYVLNGKWAVDQPGAFEAAGTQWHYSRTANGHETLEAAGPTSKDLFIMDSVGNATCGEGSRNGYTTIATATSSSEHGSSQSATSAPRHATTCRCSRHTATVSLCARASTSGCPTPATAPTCWSGVSICSWRGTTSTSSRPSTGSCCSATATPGPGHPAKTCCFATQHSVASPALLPESLRPVVEGSRETPRLLSASRTAAQTRDSAGGALGF